MGERYVVHRTPLVHSNERMHEMSEACWCFPEVALEATTGNTWVTHRDRALPVKHESNRTQERGGRTEENVFGSHRGTVRF